MIKDVSQIKLLNQTYIYHINFDIILKLIEIRTKHKLNVDTSWKTFNLKFNRVVDFCMDKHQSLTGHNICIDNITLTQNDLVEALIKTVDDAYTFNIISKDVELQILQEDKIHWLTV